MSEDEEEPTDLLDWIQDYLNDGMDSDGPGDDDE